MIGSRGGLEARIRIRRGLATDRRKVRTVSATIRRNGANQFQSSGKGEREGKSATLGGKRE